MASPSSPAPKAAPANAPRTNAPRVTATGRHFLQIPGPTNVPDRILRGIGNPD